MRPITSMPFRVASALLALAGLGFLLAVTGGCSETSKVLPRDLNDSPAPYPRMSFTVPAGAVPCDVSRIEESLQHRLPIPDYLPALLRVTATYCIREPNSKPQVTTVFLIVSDRVMPLRNSQLECTMVVEIGWNEAGLGLKMPDAEYIPAAGGRLVRAATEMTLWIESYGGPDSLGSTLRLRASEGFPLDELIDVARSVPKSEAGKNP